MRLIALRMTRRRAQARVQSLDTELLAMHPRKASARQRSAAFEFAVSNKASRCKAIRSDWNKLTNSSLLAYSPLLRSRLSNQRDLLTLSLPTCIYSQAERRSAA